MGHIELQPRRYTVEEYLALEAASEMRHEFFGGEVLECSVDSKQHNQLVISYLAAFRRALRGSEYQATVLSILLVVRENQQYAYPNLMVSHRSDGAGDPALVRQPLLLLEVTYPENEAYDRGLKFNQYKKLPSLRHYLLVSQATWLVEWYQLTEHGVWVHTALAEAEDALTIPELGLTMTLADVYEEAGVVPMRMLPLATPGSASQ